MCSGNVIMCEFDVHKTLFFDIIIIINKRLRCSLTDYTCERSPGSYIASYLLSLYRAGNHKVTDSPILQLISVHVLIKIKLRSAVLVAIKIAN